MQRIADAHAQRMQSELDYDTMQEVEQEVYEEWLASADADGIGCSCGHELHGTHDCAAFNCPCQRSYAGAWLRI